MNTKLPLWTSEVLSNPYISKEDITAVCSKMGLREFDAVRHNFLRNLKSIDVSACPGSGKTTLATAKLLLLEAKWRASTQGILILSHTNVAKNEVKTRFQSFGKNLNVNGRPHYIGTIHSFVLRFLAIPYLHSLGYPPRVVDTDATSAHRAYLLKTRYKTLDNLITMRAKRQKRSASSPGPLELDSRKRSITDTALTIRSADFSYLIGEKLLDNISPERPSYQNAQSIVLRSLKAGYLKYDEIFLFAEKYLLDNPEIGAYIRHRFPFVLVDEMQDTSASQLQILNTLFPPDAHECSIQRVGDPNQAIYRNEQDSNGKTCDSQKSLEFPRTDYISISNSYRLSPATARIANQVAEHSVLPQGLMGLRDERVDVNPIFIVFEQNKRLEVLPYFESICKQYLPEDIIPTGKIAAIGAVAKIGSVKEDHIPKGIGHYISEQKEFAPSRKRTASNLHQEANRAYRAWQSTGEVADFLNPIANAILSYWNRNSLQDERIHLGPRPFLQLRRFLRDREIPHEKFLNILQILALAPVQPDDEATLQLIEQAKEISAKVIGCHNNPSTFFAQNLAPYPEASPHEEPHNKYSFSSTPEHSFKIEVSTIHSVKGETHLATLVLDTYSNAHFIKSLIGALVGGEAKKSNAMQRRRLREAYVAITRPTHLLAVAGVETSLGKTEAEITKTVEMLENHGWRVHRI